MMWIFNIPPHGGVWLHFTAGNTIATFSGVNTIIECSSYTECYPSLIIWSLYVHFTAICTWKSSNVAIIVHFISVQFEENLTTTLRMFSDLGNVAFDSRHYQQRRHRRLKWSALTDRWHFVISIMLVNHFSCGARAYLVPSLDWIWYEISTHIKQNVIKTHLSKHCTKQGTTLQQIFLQTS